MAFDKRTSSPTVFEQQREELVREIAVVRPHSCTPVCICIVTNIGHGTSSPKHQPAESEPGECDCRTHHPTSICNKITKLINEGRERVRLRRGPLVSIREFHGPSGRPRNRSERTGPRPRGGRAESQPESQPRYELRRGYGYEVMNSEKGLVYGLTFILWYQYSFHPFIMTWVFAPISQ